MKDVKKLAAMGLINATQCNKNSQLRRLVNANPVLWAKCIGQPITTPYEQNDGLHEKVNEFIPI